MGQSVQIVQSRALRAGVVRFEINRSLTSTSHESYDAPPDPSGSRPADMLATRVFETGYVKSLHVFSNVITITLRDETAQGLALPLLEEQVRDLFIHYKPGVMPTPV